MHDWRRKVFGNKPELFFFMKLEFFLMLLNIFTVWHILNLKDPDVIMKYFDIIRLELEPIGTSVLLRTIIYQSFIGRGQMKLTYVGIFLQDPYPSLQEHLKKTSEAMNV